MLIVLHHAVTAAHDQTKLDPFSVTRSRPPGRRHHIISTTRAGRIKANTQFCKRDTNIEEKMWRHCGLIAILYSAWVIAISPAAGQESARGAFWKRVQALCNATSNVKNVEKIEPHAERIAATAEKEHRQWGGHEIDHTGRLYKFGLTEAENEEDPGDSNTVRLHKIGWWNVWRYLSVLAEAGRINLNLLRVTSIESAIDARDPDDSGLRRSNSLRDLFAAIDQIEDTRLREAAKESVIRGAVSDRPWSAVFISYVVHTAAGATAAPTSQQFAYNPRHIEYISQAFAASRAEEHGIPTSAIYRACPAHETVPRRGDLICYQRQKSCLGLPARTIQNLIAFGDRPNEACKSISMSHCDVVTHVDKDAKKVYTVGGNVFQSVTQRRMNLAENGLKFSDSQGEMDCSIAQPGTGDATDATKGRCSLNKKDWFVILQMRPSGLQSISTPEVQR